MSDGSLNYPEVLVLQEAMKVLEKADKTSAERIITYLKEWNRNRPASAT